MTATIQVQRVLYYRKKVYQRCSSCCTVNLEGVDQALNVPLSVKSIRKILLSMGYDQIEVKEEKKNVSMDNYQHAAKLKEIKERRDFIEANPEMSSEELAKKYKVSASTIVKDRKHIANRQEFKYEA